MRGSVNERSVGKCAGVPNAASGPSSDDPDVVPVDSGHDQDMDLPHQQEKGGILIVKLRRGQEIKLKAIAKKVSSMTPA